MFSCKINICFAAQPLLIDPGSTYAHSFDVSGEAGNSPRGKSWRKGTDEQLFWTNLKRIHQIGFGSKVK